MKQKDDASFVTQIADPQSFVLGLIGAEVLAKRDEDGPLARPYRWVPRPIPPFGTKDRERRRG